MRFRWHMAALAAAGLVLLMTAGGSLAAPPGWPPIPNTAPNEAPRAAPTTPVWTVPPAMPGTADQSQAADSAPSPQKSERPRYAVMEDGNGPPPSIPAPSASRSYSPPPPSAAVPVVPSDQGNSGYKPPSYSVMQSPHTSAGPSALVSGRGGFRDVYVLGTGDKLRVTVYGEPDLSGDFDVDSSGVVRLPLIGQVQAAGLTVHQFEQHVTAKLKGRYLLNPSVSAEVSQYRPFFIIGEVNKPGQYAYVNGMNVVTAVALAGGYTYRADDDDVHIRRNGGTREVERPADERTKIYPGDIIRVGERFF